MMLKELNKGVCELVRAAVLASGLGAELVAEDLSAPILRPSVKVELEESGDARAIRHRVEQGVTFRIYFFVADQYRPKLDNLAMCQALGEAFRDGIPVGEETVPIDEGLSFVTADGVLTASLDLALDQTVLPAGEELAEPMEELSQNLEVH